MSDKSVAQKLLIKPGARIRFVNPPTDLLSVIGSLPEDVNLVDDATGANNVVPADIVVFFANGQTDLATLLPGLRAALKPQGILWVAYHKGTSGVKTDINRDTINAFGQTVGLQGVAMVAINNDWSALRMKIIA